MEFVRVTIDQPGEIARLSAFATAVNREYYGPLLGEAQTEYHVEKFQSVRAITEQIRRGFAYFILENEGELLGFFAYFPWNEALYLSKFYMAKQHRGKGWGKASIAFLGQRAKELGLNAIELNVNRFNPTVAIYEHMGFVRVREEKIDIGAGFFMDDYVYRLELGK